MKKNTFLNYCWHLITNLCVIVLLIIWNFCYFDFFFEWAHLHDCVIFINARTFFPSFCFFNCKKKLISIVLLELFLPKFRKFQVPNMERSDWFLYLFYFYLPRPCFVDIMATVEAPAGLDPLSLNSIKSSLSRLEGQQEAMEDAFSRPGAQLSEKLTFENKAGDVVTAFPVIVDFRRLIQLSPSNASVAVQGQTGIVSGVRCSKLLKLNDVLEH